MEIPTRLLARMWEDLLRFKGTVAPNFFYLHQCMDRSGLEKETRYGTVRAGPGTYLLTQVTTVTFVIDTQGTEVQLTFVSYRTSTVPILIIMVGTYLPSLLLLQWRVPVYRRHGDGQTDCRILCGKPQIFLPRSCPTIHPGQLLADIFLGSW